MTLATPNRETLVNLIVERLEMVVGELRDSFENSINEVGVRYCVIDGLLPMDIAQLIYDSFPLVEKMRLMDSFRERKYTSKSFDKFAPLIADITFAIQDPRVVHVIERITGIKDQIPDSSLYAGGLSAMGQGHFLGPHIDNSHDASRENYRTLNLLYYVSPDWEMENGGNLELWDRNVRNKVTVLSCFNRLVIMETNQWSWHSVNSVRTNRLRYCVSNYYFSPASPTSLEYFNITSFSARPEQKVLRAITWFDNKLRMMVRHFAPRGWGKEDVYKVPRT